MFMHYMLQHSALWPFHLTITAVTVDRGSFSRAGIWQTDLLERWHPIIATKSLSSSVRQFYYQCLFMEIAWLCARFYKPVSNGCGWKSWIDSFEGVPTYFWPCSVSAEFSGESSPLFSSYFSCFIDLMRSIRFFSASVSESSGSSFSGTTVKLEHFFSCT